MRFGNPRLTRPVEQEIRLVCFMPQFPGDFDDVVVSCSQRFPHVICPDARLQHRVPQILIHRNRLFPACAFNLLVLLAHRNHPFEVAVQSARCLHPEAGAEEGGDGGLDGSQAFVVE